jgi:mono/diheme cytochrome c family protein
MKPLVTGLMSLVVTLGGPAASDAVLAADRAAAPAAPSASRGRQLFMSVGCVHCHGTQGQGSSAGARLAPEPLPAAALAQFIRLTNTTMPAYSARVLSDADVADIAAFLATIPSAKPVEAIPALRDLVPPGARR